MNKVIADMTNKGIKNIADLSVDAFIDLLIKRGSVNIGDNEYKKQELLKIWNDIAKDAFKTAAKNIKKQKQTNQSKAKHLQKKHPKKNQSKAKHLQKKHQKKNQQPNQQPNQLQNQLNQQ